MTLWIRNTLFTLVVPGAGGVLVPWLMVSATNALTQPVWGPALILIGAGVVLYLWCLWVFGTVGRGTPGVWDPPRRVVVAGPYRWVRNPIYISALLVVFGEAVLFASVVVGLYGLAMAVFFDVFVRSYEEPTLLGRFGESYAEYCRSAPRWIPRMPRGRATD